MVVAVCMASSRMLCRSVARESMESLSPISGPVGSTALDGCGEFPRLVSMALAVAIASEVGEWESNATSDFHAARLCGGIGFGNVGTLGVLAVFRIGLAGGMRRGSGAFPRTPLWSRNDVVILYLGLIWVIRDCGSHMARWSMHEAWSSFDGKRNVGVEGPSHLW